MVRVRLFVSEELQGITAFSVCVAAFSFNYQSASIYSVQYQHRARSICIIWSQVSNFVLETCLDTTEIKKDYPSGDAIILRLLG